MFWSIAYAQAAGATPRASLLEQMFPIVFMFVVIYFFILRPQSRRAKEHQEALKNLKRGDSVLTNGGIFGTIEGLNEKYVTLQVDENVRIKVLKNQIAGLSKEA